MRRTRVVLAATAALLAANVPAHAATHAITISDNKFTPTPKTLARGDKVTWTNKGFSTHNTKGASPLSYWTSPDLTNNKTFTTPNPLPAGTFAYSCSKHFGMSGTLNVPVGLTKVARKITIALNTVAAPTGFKYVVQQKVGTSFKTIATVTTPTHVFNAPAAGSFTFRAAAQKGTTVPAASFFSAPATISVT